MKRTFQLLIAIICCTAAGVSAQNKFYFADSEYQKMRYAHAIEAYEEAFKYAKPEASDYANLADSYYKVGDMKNAERIYATYVKLPELVKPDASAMFQYGQTLAQNGKYDEAATWFEKYHEIKTLEDDSRGNDFLKAYRHNIHDFYKDSVLFDVYRLDINSPQADFSPTFYGKGIVFASARKTENVVRRVHSWNNSAFLDLYYIDTNAVNERTYNTHLGKEQASHKSYSYMDANAKLHDDETFLTSNDSRTLGYHAHIYKKDTNAFHSYDPKLFSKQLKSKFHDGPCTFNKAQNVVVVTRNNPKGRSKNRVNNLALFFAQKDSANWDKLQPFPYNSKEYNTAHPAMSPDDKTVVFASDMPGGFGGMDLYKTTFDGSNWSKPENLGPKLNTEGNEVFPFVDEHGVLYFSSSGHPGLGGLDLFRFENSKVEHLNYPLSSKKDDFGVAIWADGRKGYLSSNRDFGGSDDDLYYFEASKNMLLAGVTYDANTKEIIPNAKVVLKDTAGTVVAEAMSDEAGAYSFPVLHDKTYKLETSKPKFHTEQLQVSTKGVRTQTMKKDVYLPSKIDLALLGLVTDRETGLPLNDVKVRMVDPKTGEEVFNGSTVGGNFRNSILGKRLKDSVVYDVHLSREGYLAKTVPFMAVINDTSEVKLHEKMDLNMDRAKIGTDIGKVLHLNPIYYDLAKWDIRTDAATELDKVVVLMQENPNIVVELRSHTDCRSSNKFNQELSDKRAKSSASYVVSKGIDKKRISGKGYGESKPVVNCSCEGTAMPACTEEEHQLNRRTEFVIVKM
jgi:outer membrane protein OmpA-like peptidoglycan-associated protein/tetratricopeptide (TPR) repeat protein